MNLPTHTCVCEALIVATECLYAFLPKNVISWNEKKNKKNKNNSPHLCNVDCKVK